MKRLSYVVSAAIVALGLALAPAALAAGHGGGGFGGHVGGFGGQIGGFGGHGVGIGGHYGAFGGEHTIGPERTFAGHPFDGGHPAYGRGFAGGGLELSSHDMRGGQDMTGHTMSGHDIVGRDLGGGLVAGGKVGNDHIVYGRVDRWRGRTFLGYYYPDPGVCYQYPGYYNPAAGCFGLEPIG